MISRLKLLLCIDGVALNPESGMDGYTVEHVGLGDAALV